MTTKHKITYRLSSTTCQRPSDGDYAHVLIEVRIGTEYDAADEYNKQPDAYHIDRLRDIRDEGASTRYFSAIDNEGFALRWQADKESWERKQSMWYGCHVEDAKFEPATCKLLARLAAQKGGFYTEPGEILRSLRAMGARPVKYASNSMGVWIYREVEIDEELAILAADPFHTNYAG